MKDLVGRHGVYKVGKLLGGGGMAEVFRGKAKDGSAVAIKKPRMSLAPEHQALFLREAEAAMKVAGKNIVRVIDWGEKPPFIAFELVKDPTLEKEIERRRAAGQPWSAPELADMYGQLVSALRNINQYVLHRDLKPANIFYGEGGVRVGDFGLAKYVDEATRSKTFKGWGTVPYMAPEVWKGTSLDWRADQYALGVVFFEVATFTVPFEGSTEELEQKHLYAQAPRADALATQLPPRIGALIARMLEKRREDRFQSWAEVASELVRVSQSFTGATNEPPDPIAKLLVKNLNAHKQQQLEHSKAQDEKARVRLERRGVIDYWWKKYSEPVKSRLDRLNQEVGGQAIKYAVNGRRLEATLFNSRLVFQLEDIPPDASKEEVGWGVLRTTTPKSVCISQLLLLREPEPYGHWLDVYMEVNPLLQANVGAAELARNAGGRYEIVGAKRLVIALNHAGVLEQRAIRNVVSFVQYREKAFEFEKSLEECLQYFVQDAHAQRASDRF